MANGPLKNSGHADSPNKESRAPITYLCKKLRSVAIATSYKPSGPLGYAVFLFRVPTILTNISELFIIYFICPDLYLIKTINELENQNLISTS